MHLLFHFCSETLQLERFRSAAHVPQDACVHTSQGRVLRDFPSAVVLPEFPRLGIIVFSLLNHRTACCLSPRLVLSASRIALRVALRARSNLIRPSSCRFRHLTT
jgi:hypothetical protein